MKTILLLILSTLVFGCYCPKLEVINYKSQQVGDKASVGDTVLEPESVKLDVPFK